MADIVTNANPYLDWPPQEGRYYAIPTKEHFQVGQVITVEMGGVTAYVEVTAVWPERNKIVVGLPRG